jgi:hypothetical protein
VALRVNGNAERLAVLVAQQIGIVVVAVIATVGLEQEMTLRYPAAFRDGVPEGIGVSVGVLVEGHGSEFLSVVCRGSRALQERLSSRGLLLHVTATRENVWQYSK